MQLDPATNEAKTNARVALLKGIAKVAEDLEKFPAPTAAEAFHHLAEAYAFVTNPAQPH